MFIDLASRDTATHGVIGVHRGDSYEFLGEDLQALVDGRDVDWDVLGGGRPQERTFEPWRLSVAADAELGFDVRDNDPEGGVRLIPASEIPADAAARATWVVVTEGGDR